jgi:hypothetical protein
MKKFVYPLIILWLLTGCKSNQEKEMQKILFLHHSTGASIWIGNTNKYLYKITKTGDVKKYFQNFNKQNNTNYIISDLLFPKKEPYGWKNYPYDYYNIWVKNAGTEPYQEEPTLEMLTKEYDVIIFKHCYPVSRILEDTGNPDIDSEEKRVENYKLQYNALKDKMHQFPKNKFIVWSPAAMVKARINEDEARRANQFYRWVLDEWDEQGDNIFVWDFYNYETEGGIYLLDKNAYSPDNSHPGKNFSGIAAGKFSEFIINVIQSKIK